MWLVYRVPPFHSWTSLLTLLSCVLQSDMWELIEGYGEKGNILNQNWKEALLETSSWCVNSPHRLSVMVHAAVHYHCFWGIYEGFLWTALRTTLIKEISSVQNVKEALWEISLSSVNISHSYSRFLRKQFVNNLFVESAKWDLRSHRGPWWQRKSPQIITREKLAEKLLSDVWLHHTDFHPSLLGTVC